jgi:hypothetical protein
MMGYLAMTGFIPSLKYPLKHPLTAGLPKAGVNIFAL